MKVIALSVIILLLMTFLGCKKESANQQIISIPNGDFEQWDNMQNLLVWQTNNCSACVPPYETYIVQKATDAENGKFAAKFVYNNAYSSYAINKFAISLHPSSLTGYIKSTIASGDTAIIHIDLFSGNNIVDNGNFYETSSNGSYRKINISISQTTINVDSALIKIVGGKKQNTELTVDNLVFLKNN
ncbi:MAG TPA: hypothetical protein VIJ75_22700 [Hanamia sp.]